MSTGGEVFTAAISAVFSYTVKSGDVLPTREEATHTINQTAAKSMCLCATTAQQVYLALFESISA